MDEQQEQEIGDTTPGQESPGSVAPESTGADGDDITKISTEQEKAPKVEEGDVVLEIKDDSNKDDLLPGSPGMAQTPEQEIVIQSSEGDTKVYESVASEKDGNVAEVPKEDEECGSEQCEAFDVQVPTEEVELKPEEKTVEDQEAGSPQSEEHANENSAEIQDAAAETQMSNEAKESENVESSEFPSTEVSSVEPNSEPVAEETSGGNGIKTEAESKIDGAKAESTKVDEKIASTEDTSDAVKEEVKKGTNVTCDSENPKGNKAEDGQNNQSGEIGDASGKERGGKSYAAQRSSGRGGKKSEEEGTSTGIKTGVDTKPSRASGASKTAEVKGSAGREDRNREGRRGKDTRETEHQTEKGTQRNRDRDRQRRDSQGDKTANKRRSNDLKGTSRDDDHHKHKGREERMKEDEERQKKEKFARELEEKKKEEERLKQIEEKKKADAEKQKISEEEAARKSKEEEEKHAKETHAEAVERKQAKMALRTANLGAAAARPDEDSFVRLDSSLKKNTSFIRKLKTLNDQQKESLTKEFQGLNLTKYVGEGAIAFSEAKLKMADIGCAVHMCSLFHQRYGEFSSQLLQGMQRALPSPKKEDKDSKQPMVFDSKIRVELRFLAELIVNGIFTEKEGLPLLNNVLASVMKGDKENHNNITIIISFTKHCGEDFAGLIPRKQRLLAEKYQLELVTSEIFSSQLQNAYRNLLKDHYASLAKYLERQHKDMQNMERQNRRILQNKGELSEERRKRHEEKQQAYQKLLMNTSTLADLIDEDMPDLPVEELTQNELDLMAIDLMSMDGNLAEFDWANSLWEDEDTRTFHENLINLRSMVPAILFKDTDQTSNQRPGDKEDENLDKLEDDIKALEIEADEEEAAADEGGGEVEVEKEDEVEEVEEAKAPEDLAFDEIETADVDEDGEDGEQISNATLKMLMDAYINSLPKCINRDHIDKAAVDFCLNLNTKANRRKLSKALFNVPRQRLDLLPFYSRLVATLYVCMPDIAMDLVERLKGEFRWHVRKKDQMMVESKVKVSRFIGELTKFKMCAKADTLQCLKNLIQDFRHHNIDMTCALLESCGRFLYRSPDSHLKTNALLELMMRKKSRMHLNERHTTMIENAFFYCNPPEVTQVERKVRPPMHEYIRKLLYKDLSKTTVEKVLKQMRKLPWDKLEIKQYAIKCLSNVWNLKYNNLHCLANLLAGLVQYHDDAGIQVVDAILEDVRIGMEINHPKYNQRRVSVIKFLGELYNYRMVESSVIFKSLYTLLRFGVTLEGPHTPLDPPQHLFRIRLVCTLLDTCGQFFDRGTSKKKLDCFLTYYQQYVLYKRSLPVWSPEGTPFPMDVDNAISDTLEVLRPKLKIFASLEEANKEVEQLEHDQMQKVSSMLPEVHLTIVQPPGGGQRLATLLESSEEEQHNSSQDTRSLNDDDDDMSDGEDDGRGRRVGRNSASNSQSQNTGEEQDELYDDYSESMTLDSAGENEDDDNVTVITGGPKLLECEEDDTFTSAFDKMLSENIQQRNAESVKVTQLDIGVPLHIKARTAIKPPVTFNPFQSTMLSAAELPEEPNTVNFVLMTRKGNKQQFKEFEVPINSELAANLKNREEAEKAEKQRMKELTLHINERQEEEDYEEMLASLQRPGISVPQTSGKSRFHHPKGAPNTDQIFNARGNRKW